LFDINFGPVGAQVERKVKRAKDIPCLFAHNVAALCEADVALGDGDEEPDGQQVTSLHN